jgi:hypothetical protein
VPETPKNLNRISSFIARVRLGQTVAKVAVVAVAIELNFKN